MLEAALSKRIIQAMRRRGCWATKIAGGPRQAAGLPDIIGCYRGVFLGLEVKRPGREHTLTMIQQTTLIAIMNADGEAHMVSSVAQVLQLLDNIDADFD